ncbi:MAG: ABC transporter permease subunit [Nostoc sp.]
MARTRLYLGVILAVVAAVLIWGVLRQTFFGFSVRVVDASPKAAVYAGIKSDIYHGH